MSLNFLNPKPPNQNLYVQFIIHEISQNIDLLIYISRIFDIHRKNNDITKIERTIELNINNVRLKLDGSKRNEIIQKIKEIYLHKRFQKIRSSILEEAVALLGPFTIMEKDCTCYREPVIIDMSKNDKKVGDSDNKCDVVFYKNNESRMEFVECKANIANVIPENLPFDDPGISVEHKRKVLYLDNVYGYLSNYYVEPTIFFACYNNNFEIQLRNIQENWGYSHFNIIGPMIIHNLITENVS